MGFKLVRIDATEPCKIPLPAGSHYIGRGVFLNCDDHRVSRQHGLLEVSGDSVKIKALHPNPCFYKKNQSEQLFVLNQGEVADLTNGSQFGLVPDSFWYEVIYCHDTTAPDTMNHTVGQTNSHTVNNNTLDTQKYTPDAKKEGTVNKTRDVVAHSDVTAFDGANDSALMNLEYNASMEGIGGSESPLIPAENPTSPKADQESSPSKRPHSPEPTSDDAGKRIKTEVVSPKQEPGCSNVKVEPSSPADGNDQQKAFPVAGPSQDPGPSADDNNNPKPPPPPPAPRERCYYGDKCYRLNPQHKAQFSHPADEDYGRSEPCPQGGACARRDPRHWAAHTHPAAARAPPPAPLPAPGVRVVQRRGNIFYINAHAVHFHDDHYQLEDEDGDSVDFDYEF